MGCHPPGCRRTLSSLLWRPTGAFGTVQRPKFVPTKNAGPTRSLIVVVVDAVESVVVMVVVFVRLDVTVRIAIPWFPCPSLPQQRESKRYGATLIQLQGTASDRQTRTQPQASDRQASTPPPKPERNYSVRRRCTSRGSPGFCVGRNHHSSSDSYSNRNRSRKNKSKTARQELPLANYGLDEKGKNFRPRRWRGSGWCERRALGIMLYGYTYVPVTVRIHCPYR